MAYASSDKSGLAAVFHPGLFWLTLATLAAIGFFWEGIEALLVAWQLPEYSHGPLIPVLSALLFLRQLKEFPPNYGAVHDRQPGLWLLGLSIVFALLGKLSKIDDIVAYALILWVAAILLISFGWRTGRHFWPPVVHLVYMLPLPGVLYYKLSTWLQMVSSELGVWLLQIIDVPVYLSGNIIDLGVLKLHVAEACSGLRYLFPILSFSYIFAVIYRGPMWHKAVLLLAAAPITVVMNSARIAVGGWIANEWGVEHLEGFTHFFEGWVVFIICIFMLFALAWVMLRFNPDRPSLPDALDLDTSGLGTQAARLTLVQASRPMIAAAMLMVAAAAVWQARPAVTSVDVPRDPFAIFPSTLGDWRSSERISLEQSVEVVLGADDYHSVTLSSPTADAPVGLFMAWYDDQSNGGTHSPEVCLPGAGWEIAWLERVDIAPELGLTEPFNLNRAVVQQGQTRMIGYYWFEQQGRHIAWDFAAKFWLFWNGITTGRTDGALVRLLTPINSDETEQEAEARLKSVFLEMQGVLPRFIPE
ncbi:VPLPA-CTERM-specific exosortase XrtD [Tateyamaria sp. ANG-S1]|uniref:VPLPA-CTERM-specific exosortase XrtD n=1 Tax=Tateyamaria sp. ANG-S1 TaxID=1577905 RepID=UPI00057F6546|nr:VPLPA-CTERM-specific exosortase XrtD [Tateyamaria sp. ANG-S1]KIC45461.1 transmembrane exosortase [Tateyamaria sp. ANG-S1]